MLLDDLKWRYATKKMDPSQKVAEDKRARILDAIQLAPTSSGLQPFHVFVVTDPKVRKALQGAAFGQAQIVDGDCVLVFAAWDTYTKDRINDVVALNIAERPGTEDMVNGYFDNLKKDYLDRPSAVNFEHAARQSYIALGVGLVAAAAEKVDATPMEGFNPAEVNKILGLPEKGLGVTALMALGHRDVTGDWLAPMKKVRRPKDELFTFI